MRESYTRQGGVEDTAFHDTHITQFVDRTSSSDSYCDAPVRHYGLDR